MCPNCSESLNENDKTCPGCGAPQTDSDRLTVEFGADMEVIFSDSEPKGYFLRPIGPTETLKPKTIAFNQKLPEAIDKETNSDFSPAPKPKQNSKLKTQMAAIGVAVIITWGGISYFYAKPSLERPRITKSEVLSKSSFDDPILGKSRFFITLVGLETPVEVNEYEFKQWEKGDKLNLRLLENGTLVGLSRLEPSK